MTLIMVVLYLLFSSFGMVLIKLGAENNLINISGKVFNLKLDFLTITGIGLYLLSFVLWVIVLQKFKLSYISPLVSGISYVLIIFLSVAFLKEEISIYQWIGIGIIFVGVIFMNVK